MISSKHTARRCTRRSGRRLLRGRKQFLKSTHQNFNHLHLRGDEEQKTQPQRARCLQEYLLLYFLQVDCSVVLRTKQHRAKDDAQIGCRHLVDGAVLQGLPEEREDKAQDGQVAFRQPIEEDLVSCEHASTN